MTSTDDPAQEVTVYWRPGCGFCHVLRRELDRAGIARREVNIWEDPTGAALVRSVAWGNETVPTVTWGATALVNPSAAGVLRLLRGDQADDELHGPPTLGRPGIMRGAVWSLVVGLVWIAVALAAPTTTYHLAPLLVALAWPAASRDPADRTVGMPWPAPAVGGLLTALAALGVLAGTGSLGGPSLIGSSPITESLVMAAVGFLGGLLLAPPRPRP